MLSRVLVLTTEDVRIYIWNCRGLEGASFRRNLFTMRSMIDSQLLSSPTHVQLHANVCTLLLEVYGMNNFYTKPLGFVGDVALLWDPLTVYVTSIRKEAMNVSFVVKVCFVHDLYSSTYEASLLLLTISDVVIIAGLNLTGTK